MTLVIQQVNRNTQEVAQKPDTTLMQSGFNELVEWTAQHEIKIDQIQGDITDLKNSVGLIREDVANLDQRIDGLDQRIDGVDQKVDSLDQKVNGIDLKVDGLDQKMVRMETNIQQILQMLEQR
ncbi:MAG: hypothetical protein AAGA75_24410 [Cyanobacteria bacterium P01_E01_bin.6]